MFKATGLHISQAIIWVKQHPVLTRKDFMANHEWCFRYRVHVLSFAKNESFIEEGVAEPGGKTPANAPGHSGRRGLFFWDLGSSYRVFAANCCRRHGADVDSMIANPEIWSQRFIRRDIEAFDYSFGNGLDQ